MNKILALFLFFALAATVECALWVPQETGRVAAAAITPATPATSPLVAVAPAASATTTASSSNDTWVNSQTCGWVASTSCKFLIQPNRVRRPFFPRFVPYTQQAMVYLLC